jgi:hypothetical protein
MPTLTLSDSRSLGISRWPKRELAKAGRLDGATRTSGKRKAAKAPVEPAWPASVEPAGNAPHSLIAQIEAACDALVARSECAWMARH